MINKHPDDSIQKVFLNNEDWWIKCDTGSISRGCLIYAYIQYYGQIPIELKAKRVDATNHTTATFEAKPLSAMGKPSMLEVLPVAPLPRLDGADCHLVHRAKKRPCLVLSTIERPLINPALTRGMSNYQTANFFLVAPSYGVEESKRSGYRREFAERIKHAEYPQFFWDYLPHSGGEESILRLDQIQPVADHYHSYSETGYRLNDKALLIVDIWLNWLMTGEMDSNFAAFRELFRDGK